MYDYQRYVNMASKSAPKEKNKRPDVSKHILDSKCTLETVVKGCLHNYIRGNSDHSFKFIILS